jgi:hypothetical protein
MRWAGHVERIEDVGNGDNVLLMKHEGRGHLEIVGLDGNIILK